MSSKKRRSVWPWFLVPALGVGGWALARGTIFSKNDEVKIQGARVQRGQLVINVVQRGNLASKDAISIKSEIEGQATVLYLIPEGTFVKPGDRLVELDSADMRDRKVAQEISVQNAEATYTKSKAQFEIQESQNKSDIESAERKQSFARLDLEKYLKGDLEQLKAAADEKIKLAEAELAKSKNTYDWSQSLAEKGFLTKTELDRDELDFQRSEVSLGQARRAKDLLLRYDDPRKQSELEANLKEAERGLERARLQAQARIADFESGLVTSKQKLDLEREKLEKYVSQLAKAVIKAVDSGMVVYTRQEGGRMGGSEPMQEGTQVRERQEILTIPRTAGLTVEASVHESVLKRVEIGKPAKIRVDSIPGKEFDGVVQFVALLADKASWWANPNQRLYKTEIAVTNPSLEMRPGMSCSLEILSDVIDDCLYVPLQAVMLHQGETIAFVATSGEPEQRKLKIGKQSDKWVQVIEGLKEAEEVLLSAPAGFTPQAGERAGGPPMRMPQRPDGAASMPSADGAAGTASPEGAPAGAASGARTGGSGERPRGERRNRPSGGGEKPAGEAAGSEAKPADPKPPEKSGGGAKSGTPTDSAKPGAAGAKGQ